MAGKVIMVKTDDAFPRLIPVTAMTYDSTTQTVVLDRVVACGAGEPSNIVPLHRCFEFDIDLINNVNALTESGINSISAAQQLCVSGLTPAELETDGTSGPLLTH
jgi:hypothetical protein